VITGAVIMAVGVLLGAMITFKNQKPDGPTMTVVKNSPAASSDD